MSRASKMLKRIKKKEAKDQKRRQRLLNKQLVCCGSEDKFHPTFPGGDTISYLEYLKAHGLDQSNNKYIRQIKGVNGPSAIYVGPRPKGTPTAKDVLAASKQYKDHHNKRKKLPKKSRPIIIMETIDEKTKLTEN